MKRKGFLLFWALCGLSAAGVLIAGMAFSLHTALEWEGKREMALDEALLAQDRMEQAKYYLRFGKGAMPSSERVTRNGRVYQVDIRRQAEEIQGVPMVRVRCRAAGRGSEAFGNRAFCHGFHGGKNQEQPAPHGKGGEWGQL